MYEVEVKARRILSSACPLGYVYARLLEYQAADNEAKRQDPKYELPKSRQSPKRHRCETNIAVDGDEKT